MKLSVVITARQEELLGSTVRGVLGTAPGAEVIVVVDGPQDLKGTEGARYLFPEGAPVGTQRARDLGIVAATGDIVVVMDAHMFFTPGWAEHFTRAIEADPRAVCCCVCCALDPGKYDMPGRHKYTGAYLKIKDMQPVGQCFAFAGKWRPETEPGEIGCIMGGCYGFARKWYVEGLRRPWSMGTAWGVDEETISAVNFLRGGKNLLVPAQVGHVFRPAAPFSYTAEQLGGIWASRFRLIEMLPMPEAARADLRAWQNQSMDAVFYRPVIDRFLNLEGAKEYCQWLEANSERSFLDLMNFNARP